MTGYAATGAEAAAGRPVVVLAGGLSYERDISLRSGRRIVAALHAAGCEATLLDPDDALLARLDADRPAAVLIALHGAAGEDGALRGVLELAGVPYVGASAAASRISWDKPIAKALCRAAGIATADWVALPDTTFRELGAAAVLDRIVERIGLPLMLKPAQGGSALGAIRVADAEDLPAAMVGCFAYASTVLIERYIDGIEVAVTVIDDGDGPRALPAVEIAPNDGVFDYAARYTQGMTTYHTPARLDATTTERLMAAAVRAHETLALRDLSRVDIIVAPDGTPVFLEVNVSPGLTDTSLMPMSVAAASLDLGALTARMLRDAARRSQQVSTVD